ncbi:MAG: aldo/keto reductase [Bacteroidia bacterium]|nr:aldo/keto reductase [Bacteroidia bacterium]
MITRSIPSSGEQLPVIGMGTWQTFDVSGKDNYERLELVLNEFYTAGGRLIDSSPMYGKAEKVIGDITRDIFSGDDYFYATKVWTTGKTEGIAEMERSLVKMGRENINLMQIHNLLDWKTHLKTLNKWKAEGRTRYTGITHYLDSSHEELERIIKSERIDFVQFNYSIESRNAEKRLLSVAADCGVATIINRPFGVGGLFKKAITKPLPDWAAELEIESWSAYFLKYIISNLYVTCVIPASGNPKHAAENMLAGSGSMPDEVMRKKMVDYLNGL